MQSYLNLLKRILEHGAIREDRTGVGTMGVFGYQWRHHLSDGFPLLTTKKVHTKSIIHELLWFLRGETNIRSLQAKNVTIWNEWADADGELGPVYGKQWRKWDTNGKRGGQPIDQIANLVRDLKTNPFSRRHIVSAWNPVDVPEMKLPPCHTLWQCCVEEISRPSDAQIVSCLSSPPCRLSLHLYARSIDSFLGLPFNIASYAFLTHMLAHVCGYLPGELVISFGDLHIYRNHLEQVREQLTRTPRPLPRLSIVGRRESMDDFDPKDFLIEGYDPLPAIKAPVAV